MVLREGEIYPHKISLSKLKRLGPILNKRCLGCLIFLYSISAKKSKKWNKKKYHIKKYLPTSKKIISIVTLVINTTLKNNGTYNKKWMRLVGIFWRKILIIFEGTLCLMKFEKKTFFRSAFFFQSIVFFFRLFDF